MGARTDCRPEPGRIDSTGLAYKGSQLQMQLYANSHSQVLEEEAVRVQALPRRATLDWVSPSRADSYIEYRDVQFLERLALADRSSALRDFWPAGGPCWDGLARWTGTGDSGVLLLEAKSYPEEATSRMMARAESSIQRSSRALEMTSTWLGLDTTPPTWFFAYYQTANRLAHLYFLRERCGVNADLVFLLVVDDPTHLPTTRSAWEVAWSLMWNRMGLHGAPPNTHALFLPGLERPGTPGAGVIT